MALARQIAQSIVGAEPEIPVITLEPELEQIAESVTEQVNKAADVETTEELAYEVALWDLISTDYSSEERAIAMDEATDKLQEEVDNVRNKEGQE